MADFQYNDGVVDLQVLSSTTHVLTGTKNSLNVLAKVNTGNVNSKKRTPLNLALVLDRSGSMTGEKINNAKAAILQLLLQLDDKDILHLVSYDSKVVTTFENQQKVATANHEELVKKVTEITPGATTNLWGGLETAVGLVVKHKQEGFIHRVFLFSDGLVNEGVTEHITIFRNVSDAFERHAVQISAFGLGDDFDEQLMRGIADKGIGTYFFIENASAIPKFVEASLNSLQSTVATNAILTARGSNFGIVEKFYGEHDAIKGAKLGDLCADNCRSILINISAAPPGGSEDTISEIVECTLTFTRDIDGIPKQFTIQKKISVVATNDQKLIAQHKNEEVEVATVLQEIAKLDKKLVKKMESQNSSGAMEILKEEIQMLEKVVEIDKTKLNNRNRIDQILKQAKAQLEKLKSEGITKTAVKEAHHKGYMVERFDDACFDLYG